MHVAIVVTFSCTLKLTIWVLAGAVQPLTIEQHPIESNAIVVSLHVCTPVFNTHVNTVPAVNEVASESTASSCAGQGETIMICRLDSRL